MSQPDGLPRFPNLCWISDFDAPTVTDLGLGLGCVKTRGHKPFTRALCPAVMLLPKENDPLRATWKPHGQSPVYPDMDENPDLELIKRTWQPDRITTRYRLGESIIDQSLHAYAHGAVARLRLLPTGMVLRGLSIGKALALKTDDGLIVEELAQDLQPLRYRIRIEPFPTAIEITGHDGEQAYRLGRTFRDDRRLRWSMRWEHTLENLTISCDVELAAWILSAGSRSSRRPVSGGSFMTDIDPSAWTSMLPENPLPRRPRPDATDQAIITESWRRYYTEDIPRLHTTDDRIDQLTDYLAYVYRGNEVRLGGLLPHPFTTSKETFWGFWMWDCCFHAIAGRWYQPRSSVWGNLLNIPYQQYPAGDRSAGCVTNTGHPFGLTGFVDDDPRAARRHWMPNAIPTEHGDGSHPPQFAQALEAVWQVSGDDMHLERLLPHAQAYNDWFEHRRVSERNPDLLKVCRWSDSGMDNSKRWGHHGSGIYGTKMAPRNWSMPLVTVDLNIYSIREQESLARLYRHLNEKAKAETCLALAARRRAAFDNAFWDAKSEFFFDVHEASGRRIPVWSPTGLMALMLPDLDTDKVQALLGHLFDPEKFWTDAPLPSLAVDDPDFRAEQSYWMGGTWMSYTLGTLLGTYRHNAEAGWRFLDRLLDLLFKDGIPNIYENYHPQSGLGQDCPNFGWHGMLLDIILTQIFGLRVDGSGELKAENAQLPASWGQAPWSIDNLRVGHKRFSVRGGQTGTTLIRPA